MTDHSPRHNTPEERPSILVVDDESGHRMMVRAVLEDAGWDVAEAENGQQALQRISEHRSDVVLLDYRMPGMNGMEVLVRIFNDFGHIPVVMLTAYGTVDTAVEAMKSGAFDFLTKPLDNEALTSILERAHEYSRYIHSSQTERRPFSQGQEGAILVGDSQAMREVVDFIHQVGPTEATVLISGESGTGKELAARSLHRASHRRKGPLINVNCAALPENLLESELFGYSRGAFTGATKDKPGRFQLAHGGTLFLDEVGDIPLTLQAKLLRTLQENVVEPLGSVRSVPVDVRIIAATNKSLKQEVEAGLFRQDLYYRLNVIELHLPPLRERPEDIPLLTSHLLEKLGKKNRKEVPAVHPAFLRALHRHDWPGNVRELENVLERALILCRSGTLRPEDLPPQLKGAARESRSLDDLSSAAKHPSLEEAEKQALIQALEAHGGHREKTANALGISRRTLQYKLSKYGLTGR